MSSSTMLNRQEEGAHDAPFELAIPPEPEYVGTARLFTSAVGRHFGCGEDRIEDVKVAVSEACTNAIKAHRKSGSADPVTVAMWREDESLWIEIHDAGGGFDPAPASTEGDGTPPDGLYEGSLGLTLIRALFPGAVIDRNDRGGMTVRFPVPLGS